MYSQHQKSNVETKELTEMHDIAVPEIPHKVRIDWDDLIESYLGDDPVTAYRDLCGDIDDTEESGLARPRYFGIKWRLC